MRYSDFLIENTIVINVNELSIRLFPYPVAYTLHKFIIFKRRTKIDKYSRDIEGALRVFWELIKNNEHSAIKQIFGKVHRKWQKTIIENLRSIKGSKL